MDQRIRLISGLILFSFVLMHFLNHGFGLFSLGLMEKMRPYFLGIWLNWFGFTLLFSAFAAHFLYVIWHIFQRRSLRLQPWEWVQLLFGLAIPFLIVNHVLATAFADKFMHVNLTYPHVLANYWVFNPLSGFIHAIALIITWVHGVLGIHYWLRTKPFYIHIQWFLSQLAIIIPTLALGGYIAAGARMLSEANHVDLAPTLLRSANITPESVQWLENTTNRTLVILLLLTAIPFLARLFRSLSQKMEKRPRLTTGNGKKIRILEGATILETMREHRLPIASVCGGRGRCTTCRIRIAEGQEHLPPPLDIEAAALSRLNASPNIRLACQLRPTENLTATPMLPDTATTQDGRRPGGLDGQEIIVSVMFVDLRNSTQLGEEKLPYDVLFILNQFFAEMTISLNQTEGHYAQFNGDGLMALYGLKGEDPKIHARQAINGAYEMFQRLEELNKTLASELKKPLQIGIGLHHGEAIVGAMGPPNNQLITAIGDNINIAARLESLCKEYQSPFIISARTAKAADISLPENKAYKVTVKGRQKQIKFYGLDQPIKI